MLALLTVVLLVAAACGSGDDGDASASRGDAESDVEDAGAGGDAGAEALDDPRWANVVVGPQASDAEPVAGGSLVVGLQEEADTFLPSASTSAATIRNVVYTIFDPLVARDANGEIRPYLAESIEPTEDFTAWTLTLRPGVRFHDDTPLDADAMKRIWDDYLAAEGSSSAPNATRFVERMEVIDERTVRYVMTEPNPTFPELLELQLGWPFSPDAADELGDAFGDQPVGTGPFRFVSWQRDSELVVERNDGYWQDGLPYLDEIVFRPIPDEATRAAALESGDLDALQSTRLSGFVADLADIDDVTVVLGSGSGNKGTAVLFNTVAAPTDDRRVRQALAYAVDQEALLGVLGGEAAELSEPRSQFFPRGSQFYSEAVADAAPSHDPGRARELYDDYVADPARSDGRDVGEPVSLTLNVRNLPSQVELAEAAAGLYEEIGFVVSVQPLEQTQATAAVVTGDYEAQIAPLGQDSSPFGEFLFYLDDPDEVITNLTDFHDDTVADVLDRLRGAGTIDEQAALAEEMGMHLAAEVPFHWLGSDLNLVATQDDVQGVRSWTFPDGTLGDGVAPGITFWAQAWLCDTASTACA